MSTQRNNQLTNCGDDKGSASSVVLIFRAVDTPRRTVDFSTKSIRQLHLTRSIKAKLQNLRHRQGFKVRSSTSRGYWDSPIRDKMISLGVKHLSLMQYDISSANGAWRTHLANEAQVTFLSGYMALTSGRQECPSYPLSFDMLIQTPSCLSYLRREVVRLRTQGLDAQEHRLAPALIGCLLPPIGLFILAWTAAPNIHRIASLSGVTICNMRIFVVFQCIFIYVSLSNCKYTASLLASNAFGRSTMSASAVLFSRPLFSNLSIGRGVSLLAGLIVECVGGMYGLWYWGASLRNRSRFASREAH